MKKYITLIAVTMAAGFVQADIAPVTESTLIRGGANGDNVYTQTRIDLKNAGGDAFTRIGVMKIDVSGIADTVTSATFSYTHKSTAANTLHVYGVLDSAGGQDWSGATATWNSFTSSGLFAPQKDLYLTASTNNPNLVELGSYYTAASGVVEYPPESVSGSALVDLLNADTDGWLSIVFSIEEDTGDVAIQDHTVSPLTQLEYAVIPEPATLGLLGMACAGLLGARRFFS